MATVSYLPALLPAHHCRRVLSSNSKPKGLKLHTFQCRPRQLRIHMKMIQSDAPTQNASGGTIKRRGTLLHVLLCYASAAALPISYASAETELQENFLTYEDEANKFRISIPRDWLVGAGDVKSIKSITAFYPEGDSESNVSVVITGLGPDFTRLESFGNVDAFAENLVNGLDRGWQRPPGLAAKLINSRAANGLYYIEYTLQNPGEKCRHILSAVGMASNGWYNRLYTVSGQFIEDESDKSRPQIEKSVLSFRFT